MEWIIKNHRLPSFDDHVIVYTSGGVTTGQLRRIDSQGEHWDFNERNQIYWSNKRVTHWMPLPNPPKQ
jgi:hypothetical protein